MKTLKSIKLLSLVSLALIAGSSLAADKKVIAITQIVSHPALDAVRSGIKDKVTAYAEKNNMELVWNYENAQGNIGIAAQIASKFAGAKPDVIVAISTPSAQAAISATRNSTIPVVFAAVTDPIAAKLVASLEKPGDRITGTYDFPPIAKQLDLMISIMPKTKTMGILYSPGEINSLRQLEVFKKEAAARGLKVVEGAAIKSTDVIPATHKLLGKVDAIYVPQDNTVMSTLSGITALAARQGKAVIVPDPEGVKSGGLATIGYSHFSEGQACGEIVVRILKGENPGDIAVKLPSDEKIFINIQVANQLGIQIPRSIIDKAFIWR